MRFGVSIILSVAKQKERSDSNPKGIGDVTSRPQGRLCSPEFMRFAGRPQMVVAWDRLVADQIAGGLYLDGRVAGYDSFALGLVRRIDFDRPICGGSPDRAASVSTDLGSRQHLSGIHQDPAAMDDRIGRFAASGRCGSGCSETWRIAGLCWVSSCSGSTGAGPNCLAHDLTNRRIPRLVGNAAPAKAADAREWPHATGRSRILPSCG